MSSMEFLTSRLKLTRVDEFDALIMAWPYSIARLVREGEILAWKVVSLKKGAREKYGIGQ